MYTVAPLSLGHKTDLVLAIQLFRNTHTHTHTHTEKPTRLLCPCNSAGKNTGVGSDSLLQGIFLTQESKLGLPQGMQIVYCLNHQASPICKGV